MIKIAVIKTFTILSVFILFCSSLTADFRDVRVKKNRLKALLHETAYNVIRKDNEKALESANKAIYKLAELSRNDKDPGSLYSDRVEELKKILDARFLWGEFIRRLSFSDTPEKIDNFESAFAAAFVYDAIDNYKTALLYYDHALSLSPKDQACCYNAAIVAYNLKNIEITKRYIIEISPPLILKFFKQIDWPASFWNLRRMRELLFYVCQDAYWDKIKDPMIKKKIVQIFSVSFIKGSLLESKRISGSYERFPGVYEIYDYEFPEELKGTNLDLRIKERENNFIRFCDLFIKKKFLAYNVFSLKLYLFSLKGREKSLLDEAETVIIENPVNQKNRFWFVSFNQITFFTHEMPFFLRPDIFYIQECFLSGQKKRIEDVITKTQDNNLNNLYSFFADLHRKSGDGYIAALKKSFGKQLPESFLTKNRSISSDELFSGVLYPYFRNKISMPSLTEFVLSLQKKREPIFTVDLSRREKTEAHIDTDNMLLQWSRVIASTAEPEEQFSFMKKFLALSSKGSFYSIVDSVEVVCKKNPVTALKLLKLLNKKPELWYNSDNKLIDSIAEVNALKKDNAVKKSNVRKKSNKFVGVREAFHAPVSNSKYTQKQIESFDRLISLSCSFGNYMKNLQDKALSQLNDYQKNNKDASIKELFDDEILQLAESPPALALLAESGKWRLLSAFLNNPDLQYEFEPYPRDTMSVSAWNGIEDILKKIKNRELAFLWELRLHPYMPEKVRKKKHLNRYSFDKSYLDSFLKNQFASKAVKDESCAILISQLNKSVPDKLKYDFFLSRSLADFRTGWTGGVSLADALDQYMLNLLEKGDVKKFAKLFHRFDELQNACGYNHFATDEYVFDSLFTRIVPMPLDSLKILYDLYASTLNKRRFIRRKWGKTFLRLGHYLKRKGLLEKKK